VEPDQLLEEARRLVPEGDRRHPPSSIEIWVRRFRAAQSSGKNLWFIRAPRPGGTPAPSPLFDRDLGQSVPGGPELGEEPVLDQAAEQLDRCALGTDAPGADHARDPEVVPHAPEGDPLVPGDQLLAELVEVFVLPP